MWREQAFWVLVFLVGCAYLTRIDQPTLRGEETRWAGCAREILATGDWIVPRQQGHVHPDRPPLVNWAIAASSLAVGEGTPLAVRLPSVLAVMLTCLVIYGYCRQFLSSSAALAAAGAYATMIQVLTLGRLAESEAILTLFVSSSLLVWHWGLLRGWPPICTWCAGYALAAMAALAKGPQGPVYFVGAVGVYLLLVRRDWRSLFSLSHATGAMVLIGIVAAWQIPYYLATDWQAVKMTWGHQAAARFDYSNPWPVVEHLFVYPLEVLGSMLPWSLFLLAFAHRGFRQRIGEARPQLIFLLTAIAVTFPSVWLATTARARYFMPLYPCFAVLVGIVIERCWQAETRGFWQGYWKRFAWGTAAALGVGSAALIAVNRVERFQSLPIIEPLPAALAFSAAALALAALIIATSARKTWARGWNHQLTSVTAVLASIVLIYNGPVMNAIARQSEDVAAAVDQLEAKLPPDARLVSFGRTHHRFAFHYDHFIPIVEWPQATGATSQQGSWFCFTQQGPQAPPLPFAWERIAVISCERNKKADPWDKVIVGRRLDVQQAAMAAPATR
jgi:4-amino-4-deoxy-L-arabinose transferase-like glycosyltransferase